MMNRFDENSMTMNKRSLTLLLLLCCCLGLSCYRTGEVVLQDEVRQISVDLSPNNAERIVHLAGFYIGETSTTFSEDKSITPERLTIFMERLQIEEPILELVIPSPDWVFYIAHNGKSPTKVTLLLTGDLDVMLNGEKHTEEIELSAGVHGFKVDRKENMIQVEHVIVPYKEP